jgi:hypothetical protein
LTSDAVDFLMSQKNGANYVVLYQMLCLKTVNTGGELSRQIGEVIIPFDIDKIHRDCKYFEKDTVVVALELYRKLGLVYENKNGFLQIANFDNLVGSETAWAEKKRIYREKQDRLKIEEQSKDNVLDNVLDNFRQEKEIRDKRLDTRYNSIDIDSNNNSNSNNTNVQHEQQDCSLPKENIFITLSLNDNSEFEVTENYLKKLKPLFPAVNIEQEFRKMCAWSINNPKKRKTRKGITRFINNWLSNAQDKAHFNSNNNSQNDFEQRKNQFADIIRKNRERVE